MVGTLPGFALPCVAMAGTAAVRSASAGSDASTVLSGDYGVETHLTAAATAGPNSELLLGQQPAVAGASSSSRPAVADPFGKGRDYGTIGIYQSNWGGRRASREVRDHVNQDVCFENPCQVLTAQEVDPAFVRLLQQGGDRDAKARSKAKVAVTVQPRYEPDLAHGWRAHGSRSRATRKARRTSLPAGPRPSRR